MTISSMARICSLIQSTITDYKTLHQNMESLQAMAEDLKRKPFDLRLKSLEFKGIMASYTMYQTMVDEQFVILQRFVALNPAVVREPNRDRSRLQLELMTLDIDNLKILPNTRKAIDSIRKTLGDETDTPEVKPWMNIPMFGTFVARA
jgi:hypothetical protein